MAQRSVVVSSDESLGLKVSITPLGLPFSLNAVSLLSGAYWQGRDLIIPSERIDSMCVFLRAAESLDSISLHSSIAADDLMRSTIQGDYSLNRVKLVAMYLSAESQIQDEGGRLLSGPPEASVKYSIHGSGLHYN